MPSYTPLHIYTAEDLKWTPPSGVSLQIVSDI